jgi:hypothetical protein
MATPNNDPIADAVAAERALLTSGETSDRRTDPTNDYRVKPPAPCFACDGVHGSVNHGFLCMQLALRASRRRVADLEATLRDVDDNVYQGHSLTAREAIAKALGTEAAAPVLVDTVST